MTNDTQKMIEQFEKQLAALKAQIKQNAEQGSSITKQRTAILASLKTAGGHQTVAEICTACGLTKGTAWRRIQELDRAGEVWLRTKYLDGGRKHTIVYHAEAVAT